jgi:hypothetical protein
MALALPGYVAHSDQHALPTQSVDHILRARCIVAQKQHTRDAVVLRQCWKNGRNLISAHDDDGQIVGILRPEPINQWNLSGGTPSGPEVLQHHAVFAQVRKAAASRQ